MQVCTTAAANTGSEVLHSLCIPNLAVYSCENGA